MLAAPLASTHWMPAAHQRNSQNVPDVAMSPGGRHCAENRCPWGGFWCSQRAPGHPPQDPFHRREEPLTVSVHSCGPVGACLAGSAAASPLPSARLVLCPGPPCRRTEPPGTAVSWTGAHGAQAALPSGWAPEWVWVRVPQPAAVLVGIGTRRRTDGGRLLCGALAVGLHTQASL